ncbi:MAG: carboxypeptidase regulatory-like domain-containing protein, partial [Methanobacterium paludis]|nr:carboxypeptidase regulatory-like domain-containing protein [Methanobacterium paludis]
MANRVLGLKEEATYGTASDTVPDWHQEVSKAKASPNSEPLTYSGGSRSIKKAKAGVMKPEASYDMKCDLKRIGHYLKAFLGNYKFTAGGASLNTHEFWGGENASLPSFTLW